MSRVIKINPSDADAYNNRGVAYHEQGNTKQAIKDLEKAVKLCKQQGNQELYQKALNNLKRNTLVENLPHIAVLMSVDHGRDVVCNVCTRF